MPTNPFDASAATWDENPQRVDRTREVGEAILRHAAPPANASVLDYGCGTGMLGLYLLDHVGHVTGADSSAGMLEVLRRKIAQGGIDRMQAVPLNLESDPVPADRYDLIVSTMTLHHIDDVDRVLEACRLLLVPGGQVCIVDLDAEPGTFHGEHSAQSVHHHGFDRQEVMDRLHARGFVDARAVTATELTKQVNDREESFSLFLIIARRPEAGQPGPHVAAAKAQAGP